MVAVAQQMRTLRIIFIVFLATVFVHAFVAESVHPPKPKDTGILVPTFAVIGIAVATIALMLRKRDAAKAVEALRTDPANAQAQFHWYKGHLVAAVLAESIGLLGFAIRFVGATLPVAAAFYAANVVLLFILWPAQPEF